MCILSLFVFCLKGFTAIFPHHLASVVVKLPVGPTTQDDDGDDGDDNDDKGDGDDNNIDDDDVDDDDAADDDDDDDDDDLILLIRKHLSLQCLVVWQCLLSAFTTS